MAQDVISTLFNTTPRNAAWNQYMQERMIDVNAAGRPYQDLGRANIERASAMMQNAGTGLGIGIGRLLGGMTPQMAQEQQVQGLLGGASFQDPEQLMMASERFAQAGDIPRAQVLADKAQEIRAAQATQAEAAAKKQAAQIAYQNRLRALQSRFPNMPEVEAQALAADEAAFRKLFEEQQAKLSTFGQQLVDAGLQPGSPEFQKQMQRFINNELTPKKSIGDQIAAGLSPLVGAIAEGQAKRAGETGGAEVGKATATIQGKDDALIALQNASRLLKDEKGKYAIYSGFYGPSVTSAVKATGGFVGDRQKVVQTEKFLNEVRTTVIPLLAEFGGNDSNEELKFLQGIVGGDQTLEPESIDAILKSAQAKIARGIKRVQDQQAAVVQGRPLPTGTTSQNQPQTRRTSSGVTYTVVPQ